MKTIRNLILSSAICIGLPAQAASWNSGYGMGNYSDDWLFGGAGVPLAVVASVQSNSLYYITSAAASGAPQIQGVWFKSDTLSSTLDYYIATNTYTVFSNSLVTGTNLISLDSTNGLGNGDILVLRTLADDNYQFLINSNSSSSNLIVMQFTTNALAVGDKVYKMTKVQTFDPLKMASVTNQFGAIAGVSGGVGQWWSFPSLNNPMIFQSKIGLPSMLVLTYSNAASLQVFGQYLPRARRF